MYRADPVPPRVPAEKSRLTVDAVKLHNELQGGALPMEEEEEGGAGGEAATERSSGTFLSGLSDCSNATFSKVQRFWESSSAAHKEVLGDTGRYWGSRGCPLHPGH